MWLHQCVGDEVRFVCRFRCMYPSVVLSLSHIWSLFTELYSCSSSGEGQRLSFVSTRSVLAHWRLVGFEEISEISSVLWQLMSMKSYPKIQKLYVRAHNPGLRWVVVPCVLLSFPYVCIILLKKVVSYI